MPRLIIPSYTVVKDTREQRGWEFSAQPMDHKSPRCDGMVVETLETGDYSMVGYTDILAIERKFAFSELWTNYSKAKRPAFEAEMARMSKYKYAYILIESSFSPDVMELSPPQFTTGVPGRSLIRWLMQLTVKYGVNIIPVGACGKQVARLIFEEVVRAEKDRWVPMPPKNYTDTDREFDGF